MFYSENLNDILIHMSSVNCQVLSTWLHANCAMSFLFNFDNLVDTNDT